MSNNLNNISPIDGRYSKITKELTNYFSESALIKYRVFIEIQYLIHLSKIDISVFKHVSQKDIKKIEAIYNDLSIQDIKRIKKIESVTNHDVKAVEYFLKEKFDKLKLGNIKEFIHFGLTSQDINNTASPLLFKDYLQNYFYPQEILLYHLK